jgi:hypothetical protein
MRSVVVAVVAFDDASVEVDVLGAADNEEIDDDGNDDTIDGC